METILDLVNEKIQGVVPTQKLIKYFGQTEKNNAAKRATVFGKFVSSNKEKSDLYG